MGADSEQITVCPASRKPNPSATGPNRVGLRGGGLTGRWAYGEVGLRGGGLTGRWAFGEVGLQGGGLMPVSLVTAV